MKRTIFTNDGGWIVLDLETGKVVNSAKGEQPQPRKPSMQWIKSQHELVNHTGRE